MTTHTIMICFEEDHRSPVTMKEESSSLERRGMNTESLGFFSQHHQTTIITADCIDSNQDENVCDSDNEGCVSMNDHHFEDQNKTITTRFDRLYEQGKFKQRDDLRRHRKSKNARKYVFEDDKSKRKLYESKSRVPLDKRILFHNIKMARVRAEEKGKVQGRGKAKPSRDPVASSKCKSTRSVTLKQITKHKKRMDRAKLLQQQCDRRSCPKRCLPVKEITIQAENVVKKNHEVGTIDATTTTTYKSSIGERLEVGMDQHRCDYRPPQLISFLEPSEKEVHFCKLPQFFSQCYICN